MQLGEIISDALKYPFNDYGKWLVLGVLFIVCSLGSILAQFKVYNNILSLILIIVSVIVSIIVLGYALSVLRNGIELSDEIPDFDWTNNFVDGIKYVVVTFVYFLIPSIIVSIISFITGYGPLSKILTQQNMQKFAALNGTVTANDIFNIVPKEVWASLFTSIAITAIIALILFIIFAIFDYVALCRLAKYDSLGEAFAFKEVFSDIKEIGFLKILAYLIIALVISSIVGIILAFVSAVPFIGIIVAALFGNSFLILFNNRALGLLYSDV